MECGFLILVLVLALLGTQTTRVLGAVGTSSRPYEQSNLAVPSAAMMGRCPKKCGNLSFAYPFGMGTGCFRNPDFNLTCVVEGSTGTSRLFLRDGITEVAAGHWFRHRGRLVAGNKHLLHRNRPCPLRRGRLQHVLLVTSRAIFLAIRCQHKRHGLRLRRVHAGPRLEHDLKGLLNHLPRRRDHGDDGHAELQRHLVLLRPFFL